jgi:hypothetical protein
MHSSFIGSFSILQLFANIVAREPTPDELTYEQGPDRMEKLRVNIADSQMRIDKKVY